MKMATRRKKGVPARTAAELLAQVKDLIDVVPVEKLGAGLKKVGASRGLRGARLELHFSPSDDPYYNVYRYAFFGKVPESLDVETPGVAVSRGAKILKKEKQRG
jgi:hypothetical protein